MTERQPKPGAGIGLIDEVADWLMSQALGESDIENTFVGCCERLRAAGIPLWRSHIAFRTLHPLFESMGLTWHREQDVAVEGYEHRAEGAKERWTKSPHYHMIEADIPYLRRRLAGPEALTDYPVLEELKAAGGTDYFAFLMAFTEDKQDGVIGSWATDRPSGFSDADIQALKRIQRRLGVACKVTIKDQLARNVLTAYLGANAGERVMRGQIRRGEGETINAVIWYSDLRHSTPMADTLPPADFLAVLNCYFECSAGAVLAGGGEILSFIGDAVLAIFPIETNDEAGSKAACIAALDAARDASARLAAINDARATKGDAPLAFGLGLHIGKVMYGNIGIPERLEFTVIGPTINEVARLEDLTKTLSQPVLVSGDFAACQPDQAWISLGAHALRGVGDPVEVFAPAG